MFESQDGEINDDYDKRKRQWYQTEVEKDGFVWTEQYIGANKPELMVNAAA